MQFAAAAAAAPDWRLERAEPDMADEIRTMQARSMRVLGRGFYAPEAIESFLRHVGTLDQAVVAEGHYFVVRDGDGAVIGSGGWSRLRPFYEGGGEGGKGPPVVRSVFVDPDHARRGIATALMRHAESDAAAHGCRMLRLCATLSGVPFYESLGYRPLRRRVLRLGDGAGLACVDMEAMLAQVAA